MPHASLVEIMVIVEFLPMRDGTAFVCRVSTKLSSLWDKAAEECIERDFPQARFVNKPRSQPMRFGFCRM